MGNTRIHDRPRRPPRLEQLFPNVRPFYFVTFNTHQRLPLLAHPKIHETFRSFCFTAQQYEVAVGRYVLMPDHAHVFVSLPATGVTLPKWVQTLRTVIGSELFKLGFQKPHWQGGLFDHLFERTKAIRRNGITFE